MSVQIEPASIVYKYKDRGHILSLTRRDDWLLLNPTASFPADEL